MTASAGRGRGCRGTRRRRAVRPARRARADFPIFATPREKPLRLPRQRRHVAEAATPCSRRWTATTRTCNANIHRGVYRIAEEATALYEDARRRVAAFLGAASPREIVFTRNSTEAINLVAHAWGRTYLKAGDAIVLTPMEHHSNLVPWHMLAAERKIELRFIPLTGSGELDVDALPALLADGRVKLVSFVHVSNVLGTVNPVAEIARIAHAARRHGAGGRLAERRRTCRSTCARWAPTSWPAPAHKMLGPTGIGVLWGRRELLEAMPPFLGGGEMIREVTLTGSKWNELPWKFEAGTMPIAEAVGLGAAVALPRRRSAWTHVFAHDRELVGVRAWRAWPRCPALRMLGPPADRRGGVIAFTLEGVHPHDVATVLDDDGVCVRAGHHCAMPLHEALGVPASARASFHCYSLPEEVDALVAGLHRAREVFRAG